MSYSSGNRSSPLAATVRQARLAEAAVAPGRRPADRLGLEQHDPPIGVPLLGEDGGPEAAVAAADDGEVGRRP